MLPAFDLIEFRLAKTQLFNAPDFRLVRELSRSGTACGPLGGKEKPDKGEADPSRRAQA
jgi:hypothetical protein